MNVISGQEDEPWEEQYKFGWMIIGRVCKDKPSQSTSASANRVTVEREMLLDRAIETPKTHPFISPTLSSNDMTSPKQVREMMELDYSEIHHTRKICGTEQTESMENKRFREILDKGLHKNSNSNWEAPLPFKTDAITLPNNRKHCLRRLLSLKRKLLNDDKLKLDYLAFMKKTLDNGHTSRIPADQLSTNMSRA